MTLGLYEERSRRRRSRRLGALKWLLAISAIGAVGIFAYESGSSLAQRQVEELTEAMAVLTAKVQQLEGEKASLDAARAQSEQRLAESEAQYQRDVPRGELAELIAELQAKLDQGVARERLSFLIAAAENGRECDEVPLEKRFILTTPLYVGGNDSVSFAEGLITVTGEGDSFLNEAGKAEEWFDPAKPVTLRFLEIDGEETEVAGVLPMTQSIVIGEREYRFSATAGARGFVQITSDSCRFP